MNSTPDRKTISKNTESQTADPFAADIFAGAKKNENFISDDEARVKTSDKPAWIWRLPKASRPPTNWTNLLQNLSEIFTENLPRSLAESLAAILNSESKSSIDFVFVENREGGKNEEDRSSEKCWQALIGIEPNNAKFSIEIEDYFAAWLIDRALGENNSASGDARDLTTSELAVLEYLLVNLVYEANSTLAAPLFRFISLSRKRARLITSGGLEKSGKTDSVLISKWQAVYDSRRSLIKIVSAPETLENLQSAENVFLSASQKNDRLLRAIASRVSDVRARVVLGEIKTTLDEIAGIGTGDVILFGRHDLTAVRNEFYGCAEVFLGEGETFRLAGAIATAGNESPVGDAPIPVGETQQIFVRRVNANRNLQFSISYFETPSNADFIEKSMNEDFDNLSGQTIDDSADESNGDSVALENLAVNLRVELEARRLTLAEVGSLRVNQIIELGARATDALNLIVNDKTIALGELVEVEDRLGIRIIQILR